MVGNLLRYLIMAVLLGIVGYYLWINRAALLEWWQRLFDKKKETTALASEPKKTVEPEIPPKPFSSFTNPIGRVEDNRKVIVITFQAFDAWAREQGHRRRSDETPSEFIRRVASKLADSAPAANAVVEAYNCIVFGRGRASQRDVSAAKEVWTMMKSGRRMHDLASAH